MSGVVDSMTTRRATRSRRRTRSTRGRARRIQTRIGIVLLAAGVCLFVCLWMIPPDSSTAAPLEQGPLARVINVLLVGPLRGFIGIAAYIVPFVLGFLGGTRLWSRAVKDELPVTTRSLAVIPVLAILAGLVGLVSGAGVASGGLVAGVFVSYFQQLLGPWAGATVSAVVVTWFTSRLFGVRPWRWILGTPRRPGVGRRLVRWLRGLVDGERRGVATGRISTGGNPRSQRTEADGRTWSPNLSNSWTDAPTRDTTPAPLRPPPPSLVPAPFEMPRPEVDHPLALELLPEPPPCRSLSDLDDQLVGLGDAIITAVERTTSLRLERTEDPPVIGLSFLRFEFAKRAGQRIPVTRLERAVEDIGLATGRAPARLEISDKVRIELPLAPSERRFAPIKQLLSDCRGARGFNYILGRRPDGSPFELPVREALHVLVAGGTGSGKTGVLHAMICSLAFRYAPSQVRLALFDPKQVEFCRYQHLPHLLRKVLTTPDELGDLLGDLRDELERRKAVGARDADASFTPFVIILDEFAGQGTTTLTRLVAESRAFEIYFVLGTQHPTAEVVSSSIKANLMTRIALKTRDKTGSQVILGRSDAAALEGPGDALVDSFLGLERIQAAFVSKSGPGSDLETIRAALTEGGEDIVAESVAAGTNRRGGIG